MSSSGNTPMNGEVHVDEFILGGKDEGKTGRSYDGKKKKVITTVQLTQDGKVKKDVCYEDRRFLYQITTIHLCQPHKSRG